MIVNTVGAVISFRVLRVLKYSSSVMDFLETISVVTTAVVAITENVVAGLRVTEDRGRDIFVTANLNCMATLRNSLFDLGVAPNDF